jgi:drug/metabolite transporter (DMT)-like permease
MSETAFHETSALHERRIGMLLILGSALTWSFGGALARFLSVIDPWTVIFWRSGWAAAFLLAYMLKRDGVRLTILHFRRMGLAGIGVSLCFASASMAFVVALQYTSVANILLVQAGGPLIAASMAWLFFNEKVSIGTWVAIAAVIFGIGVMESESLDGNISPIGGALSLTIALVFAVATVITRRFAHVEMVPAVTLGVTISFVYATFKAPTYAVTPLDMLVLFAFGALNLGGGLAMFVAGARRIPASIASLIGTAEPVLGPVWVWLIHNETPSLLTLIGGLIVLGALLGHSVGQIWRRNG